MNIFFLALLPAECARYHCDKHCIKMILETAQLLYTCLWLTIPDIIEQAPLSSSGKPGYRKTHMNHPCSVWLRESKQNYHWLCLLGLELCKEYTYRYEKTHATQKHIEWLMLQLPPLPDVTCTTIKLAMPVQYKGDDGVQSYRDYYIGEKKSICTWKRRETPAWFK
jgi:hypothetical protein